MGGETSLAPLLDLPLELKEQIYQEVLLDLTQGTELLRTSREIYYAAHKFLFQRPLVFRSQPAIVRWIEEASVKHLHHVTDITLTLQDVDLTPLLTNLHTGKAHDMPRMLSWELYELELERLELALHKLPNLKSLTLIALPDRQSFLYHSYVDKVLEFLNRSFPALRRLTLAANFHRQSLAFLENLKGLRHFSFGGFSTSTPTKTASILQGLEHLESLSLCCEPSTIRQPLMQPSATRAATHLSVTADVFRAIKPLCSLAISECLLPRSPSCIFFNPDILSALQERHAATMSELAFGLTLCDSAGQPRSVQSDWPNLEGLESQLKTCQTFMEKMDVGTLDLDMSHLPTRYLECLLPGQSLKELRVSVNDEKAAWEVLHTIYSITKLRDSTAVPNLERVIIDPAGVSSSAAGVLPKKTETRSREALGDTKSEDHAPFFEEMDMECIKLHFGWRKVKLVVNGFFPDVKNTTWV